MAEREQSSRTTLSFSIDNILRDDFSRSSRVNRSFPFALASHTSHVHRESLACQECSSSARYIRPVYFYTAPSIASRTEVGTRVVRSHSNSRVQSTNSKNSGQEKSLANSIQTTGIHLINPKWSRPSGPFKQVTMRRQIALFIDSLKVTSRVFNIK